MLLDNSLGHLGPGSLLLNAVRKWTDARRRHVIDYDVRLGREPVEEISEPMEFGNFAAVIRAARGPEKEVASFVLEQLKALPGSVQ